MSEYQYTDEYGEPAEGGGNAGGEFKREHEFKLPEIPGAKSHNLHRIRPPAKCVSGDPDRLIRSGTWAYQHRIHWSKVPDPERAGEHKFLAHLCVEVVDWYQWKDEGGRDRPRGKPMPLVVACASCAERRTYQKAHEEATAQLKAAQAPKDQFDQVLGPLNSYLKSFTFDDRFRVHTFEWDKKLAGRLRLSPSAFRGSNKGGKGSGSGGLVGFCEDMKTRRNINPISARDGIVIDVMREGGGLSTLITFAEHRDASTDQIVRAPITEAMAATYRAGCVQDIDDPSPAVLLSPTQVEEVVKLIRAADWASTIALFKAARRPECEPNAHSQSQAQVPANAPQVFSGRPQEDPNAAMAQVTPPPVQTQFIASEVPLTAQGTGDYLRDQRSAAVNVDTVKAMLIAKGLLKPQPQS